MTRTGSASRPNETPTSIGRGPDLDPATVDASTIWVGTQAQKAFTAHHDTDAESAIDEIQGLIETALSHGKYERRPNGFHRLEYKGFAVIVTPDGETATHYETMHAERTPSEVFSGVRSRFRKGSGTRREPGPPKPLAELAATFDPYSVRIGPVALYGYAKSTGLDPDDEDTETILRADLARGVDGGAWRISPRGPSAYVLETGDRHWIVAADDGTIITHYESDAS